MKRYENKFLNELLDRYESSLVYTGKNKVNRRITYAITKRTLPEYFDLSSLTYDRIHEELLELEARGWVKLHWNLRRGGHVVQEVELMVEKALEVYRYLGRTPKAQVEIRALEVIRPFLQIRDGVTEHAAAWLTERIAAGESVKKYIDIACPSQVELLLNSLHWLVTNRQERYVREFSILHYHDSKAFENLEGKVLSLIRHFYAGEEEGAEEMEDEPLLNLFGVYRNPAYVMVKGQGTLRVTKEGETHMAATDRASEIDLGLLPGGIGLHSQDLQRISLAPDLRVRQVMTIENLTVFHRLSMEGTLLIYLGGYHNRARRQFLKMVHQALPEASYLHFGDLDCGGLQILADLREKTGIPFVPYRMDEATLSQYGDYCRPLTANDRRRLEKMLADERFEEFRGVMTLMLASNRKLEQECIGL